MFILRTIFVCLLGFILYKYFPVVVDKKFEEVKYVIYSAHDWTVAQHILFLDATNGNFTNLPFASAVNYELHST